MAHESFENEAIAAVMNDRFVNVKVDREERPDVDAVYMQAVQAMTGSGGWPMTVFLDPEGRPFYGGTYFPPEDRQGMPGFVRLLEAVDDAWHTRRGELLEQADQLRDAIEEGTAIGGGRAAAGAATGAESPAVLDAAVRNIGAQFDSRFGGFGRAPKFPQAMTLTFLLDRGRRRSVARGARDDHGVARRHGRGRDVRPGRRRLPPLLGRRALAGAALREDALRPGAAAPRLRARLAGHRRAPLPARRRGDRRSTCCATSRHPDGGFFSAEDADSEGVEGKFYVWSLAELEPLCGDDLPEVVRYFGVTADGNFEDPHTAFRGNILHVVDRTEDRPAAVAALLPTLFAARERRVRPGLDDKVLLGWNALFLRALAEAADALDRADWMEAARTNARFLLRELRRADGRLLRSWQDGRANLLAYAEDYAALLEALLTLAELDDVAWLADAAGGGRTTSITLFSDDERGGFFTTGTDADALIVRPKDYQDNATPVGELAGRRRPAPPRRPHRRRQMGGAGRTLGRARSPRSPASTPPRSRSCSKPSQRVVTRARSRSRSSATPAIRAASPCIPRSAGACSRPRCASRGAGADEGGALTPLLADRPLVDGRATAYVCERFACRVPVTDADALRDQLDAALAARALKPVEALNAQALNGQRCGMARPSASASAIAQP